MAALPPIVVSLIVAGASAGAQFTIAMLTRPKAPPPVDKGKFDDVRATTSEYGGFIPRFRGLVRIGGHVAWTSGIVHTIQETPSNGGKGSPQPPATRTHVYQTTVGVILGRGVVYESLRIWEDADLKFRAGLEGSTSYEAEDADVDGGHLILSNAQASGGQYVALIDDGDTVTFDTTLDFPEPSDGGTYEPHAVITVYYRSTDEVPCFLDVDTEGSPIPITLLNVGTEWSTLTVEIASHPGEVVFRNEEEHGINLDRITVDRFWYNTGGDGDDPRFITQVTRAVNPNIRYPDDIDDPTAYYNYQPEVSDGMQAIEAIVPGEAMRFYQGLPEQIVDPAYITYLDSRFGSANGEARASAFRDLGMMVHDNVTLKNGRVPNWTYELRGDIADVDSILEMLFDDVGITSYDLSAIAGKNQQGWLEYQAATRRALVDLLRSYHQFRLVEIGGSVVAIDESRAPFYEIATSELRAYEYGSEMPQQTAEISMADPRDLPREVSVSVMNREHEYHNEAVTSEPMFDLQGERTEELTFNIVDTAANAREKANIIHAKRHAEDKAFEMWGMPSLAKYSPGDVLRISLDGQSYQVRLEKHLLKLPIGPIKMQAVSTEYEVYRRLTDSGASNLAAALKEQHYARTNFPRNSIAVVIPSIPITEKDKGKLGVYIAVSGRGLGAWDSAALYREFADGDYRLQKPIDSPSPMGIAQTDLDTWTDPTDEDNTSELEVYFFDDVDLETITLADIARYPNINLIRVGDEWLQFRTAMPIALDAGSKFRSAWTLTNLHRGRHETTAAMASHGEDEYCTVVTPALLFLELNREDIGKTLRFKAVTNGQSIEVAPVTEHTFEEIGSRTVRSIADFYTDTPTSGTSVQDIFTAEILSRLLTTPGDAVFAEFKGFTAANGNSKSVISNLNADTIANYATTANNKAWELEIMLMRNDVSDELICTTEFFVSGASAQTDNTILTGIDFAALNELILALHTASGAGDLTLRSSKVWFMPAAYVAPPFVNNYTLDCGSGSYGVTGNAVALRETKKIAIASGSYAVTGTAVTFTGPPTIAPGAIHDWDVASLGLSNNDPISSWVDGINSLAVAASGSNRPTYKTGITPSGAPVVRFDGSDDYLAASNGSGVLGADAYHIFLVAAFRPASDGGNETVLSIRRSGNEMIALTNGSSQVSAFDKRDGTATSSIYLSGQFALYEIINPGVDDATNIELGLYSGIFNGEWDIARLIIYPSEVTGTDLTDMRDYLTDEYL